MLRHLHWWLAIAMLPLAISIFLPQETTEDLNRRFIETLLEAEASGEKAAPESSEIADSDVGASGPIGDLPTHDPADDPSPTSRRESAENQSSEDAIFLLLPGHKLKGALLARDTYLHWLFAALSTAGFLALLMSLTRSSGVRPLHLLGLGLITATAGVTLLLGLQSVVAASGGRAGRGIGAILLLLLMLIAASYQLALDPEMGILPSFLGFTAGVGFCEELIKALPILIYFRVNSGLNWRGAFLWGLASGAGFGIAEGIIYSQGLYNGISGPLDYLVRFISCVALHAIWTGCVGIAAQQRQQLLQEDYGSDEWWMFLLVSLRLISIPMVLHGLYDTLLKKDLPLLALLVAVASFGYLAWLFGQLRQDDETTSRARFVARYARNQLSK